MRQATFALLRMLLVQTLSAQTYRLTWATKSN